MPETLTGLWKQRLRWATGGAQAIIKYRGIWGKWTERRMWPVYVEYGLSLAWAYMMLVTFITFLIGLVIPLPPELAVRTLLPGWTGLLIAATALLQSSVAMLLDARYDHRLWRNYFYMIWYPFAYWLINMMTAVVAFPKALLRKKEQRGLWLSPDRGLR